MEQVCEQTTTPNFEREKTTSPPPMKSFLFSPAPAAGMETPSPKPAADSDIPQTDTADTDTAAAQIPAAGTGPESPSPMPSHTPPPMPGPQHLFQFEPHTVSKAPFGTADRQSVYAENTGRPLPELAAAYFQQMLSQFEAFPVSGDDPAACLHFNPQAMAVISRLCGKFAAQTLVIEDLGRMEIALLAVMPARALPGYGRSLRVRYRDAGSKEMVCEKAEAEMPPEVLRAELGAMLNELQQRSHLRPELNRQRTEITRICISWIVGLSFAGIVAAGFSLIQPVSHEAEPLVLLLAALLSGATGGFTSLLIKAQQTRLDITPEYVLEWQARASLPFFFPVLGAVFAAVLFFLCAAFLSRSLLSVSLVETSRLLLCGFAAGLAAGLLPDFGSRLRLQRTSAPRNRTAQEPAKI